MKLWEINGATPSQEGHAAMRNVVMSNMRAASKLLEYLEFYTFKGSSDKIYPKSDTKGGSFRKLNDKAEAKTTNLGTPINMDWFIYSDTVQTDRALINRGIVVTDEHIRSLIAMSQSLGRDLTHRVINGTGVDQISGLKKLITGNQVLPWGGADGGYLPIGDSAEDKALRRAFFEYLNKVIYALNPDCLVMNSDMIARIETCGMEFVRTTKVKDALGKEQRIVDYKGFPLVDAGFQADEESLVIGSNESCGTSNDCTSIYAVKYGEKKDVVLSTTESGLYVAHTPNKDNFVSTDIELQFDQKIARKKSAVRLNGIRLNKDA